MPKPRQSYSYVDEWKSRWEPDLDAIGVNRNSCDPTRVDPKVLQWAKDNCTDKPHFIKIINSGAANGRPGLKRKNAGSITVPSPFVREHFKRLGRVVTLENKHGRTWRVSFGAPKRDPQWLQGWERVATENDFKPGDVVVFVLVADSHFRFTLFDEGGNTSEKTTPTLNSAAAKKESRCSSSQKSHEAPSVSNLDEQIPKTKKRALMSDNIQPAPEAKCGESGKPIPPQMRIPTYEQIAEPFYKERKLRIEETSPHRGSRPSNRTLASQEPGPNSTSTEEQKRAASDNDTPQKLHEIQPLDPFAFTFKSKRRLPTPAERQSAMDAAMAHARILTDHHFVTVMSKFQVYSNFHLVLPDSFVTKSCFPTSTTKLTIMDCEGKPWDMHSKQIKSNEVAFHRKFLALFALNHLLEEGDVCTFHLKKNSCFTEPVLQVHIFRVVPIRMIPGRSISVHNHFETHKIEKLISAKCS